MKNIIVALVALALLPFAAEAQFSAKKLTGLGMRSELANYFQNNGIKFTGNQGLIVAPTAIALGAAAEGTPAAKVTPYAVINNTGINFSSATAGVRYPAAVIITPATSFPTPPATPGTADQLGNRLNIIAAGAPTAAFVELPRATIAVGATYKLANQGSNPVAIVPVSGDTQGVAAAATPYSCATTKLCECTAFSTSAWVCGAQ